MDLQAILDSAESSSSSFSVEKLGDHRGSSSFLSLSNPSNSVQSYNDSHRNFRGGSGGREGIGSEDAVDLEKILREDDEDDDEDGVSSSSGGGGFKHDGGHNGGQRPLKEDFLRPKRLSSSRKIASINETHNSNKSNNNPEEWDILQAILGEDDDDEDDNDYRDYDGSEYRSEASSSRRARVYSYEYNESENKFDDENVSLSRQRRQKIKNNDVDMIRNNKQVDIILQQSDDDGFGNDDDIGDAVYDFSSSMYQYTEEGSRGHRNDYSENANELRRKCLDSDDDGVGNIVDVANVDSFMTAIQSADSEVSNRNDDEMNNNNFIITTTISNEYSNATYYIPTPISTTQQQSTPPRLQQQKSSSNKNPVKIINNNDSLTRSDAGLEKASWKALQVARAREAKLLKSTREARDSIVSLSMPM